MATKNNCTPLDINAWQILFHLVVMESLFCVGGEFSRLSANIIRIKFAEDCFITFELDEMYPSSHPNISVSLQLHGRKQNDDFRQVYMCHIALTNFF